MIALAGGIVDTEIMLGVLIEIFSSNSVVGDRGFPREADVTLEYLKSAATDLDVGTVAVERLMISLGRSWGLLEWPGAVVAPGWTLT